MTTSLRRHEDDADGVSWPAASVDLLRRTRCFANAVPHEFGGIGATPRQKLEAYEAVAAGSLTLALILTQHDAACELLARCENPTLSERMLRGCAAGNVLLTVGISQLTTSRRGKGPAMRAMKTDRGFRLSGVMPWVTSARKADFVVTGGVLDDERQILACIALDADGVHRAEPMQLAALNASWTSEVRCDGAFVGPQQLMRGPCEQALARRAPVKALTVSSVAAGVARALMDGIRDRKDTLPDATALIDQTVEPRYAAIRAQLFEAADALDDGEEDVPAVEIRTAVNDLVTRLSATYMTLAKGTGFLSSHRAQRLGRESMFFLVWSAPSAVQLGTFDRLWA